MQEIIDTQDINNETDEDMNVTLEPMNILIPSAECTSDAVSPTSSSARPSSSAPHNCSVYTKRKGKRKKDDVETAFVDALKKINEPEENQFPKDLDTFLQFLGYELLQIHGIPAYNFCKRKIIRLVEDAVDEANS